MDRSSPESLIHFLDNATSSVRAVLDCSLRTPGEEEPLEDVPQKSPQNSPPTSVCRKVKVLPRRRLKRFRSQRQGSLREVHPQTVNDILRLSEQSQGDCQNGYTSQWIDSIQCGSDLKRDYEDGKGFHSEWQGPHNGERDDSMNATHMYQQVQNFSPDSNRNRSIDECFTSPSNPQTTEDVANIMPVGCHLPPPLPSAYNYPPVRRTQEGNLQSKIIMKDPRLPNMRQDNPKAKTQVGQGRSQCGNVRDLLSELVTELEKTNAFDVLTGQVPSCKQQVARDGKHWQTLHDAEKSFSRSENNSPQAHSYLNFKRLTCANKSNSLDLVNAFQEAHIGSMDGTGAADTNGPTSYGSRRNVTINHETTAETSLCNGNAHSYTDSEKYYLSCSRRDKMSQLKHQTSLPNLHLSSHQQPVDSWHLLKSLENSHSTQSMDMPWRAERSNSSCLRPDQAPKETDSWMPNGHQIVFNRYSKDPSLERNDFNSSIQSMGSNEYGHRQSPLSVVLTEGVRKMNVTADSMNLIPANYPHASPEWTSSSSMTNIGVTDHRYSNDIKQDSYFANQSNVNFGKFITMTSEYNWDEMSNSNASSFSSEQQQQQRYQYEQQQQQLRRETLEWNNQAEIAHSPHPYLANTNINLHRGSTMSSSLPTLGESNSHFPGTPPAYFPSSFHPHSPQIDSDLNQYDRVDVCMSPPVTDSESYWSEDDGEHQGDDDADDIDADSKNNTAIDGEDNWLQNNINKQGAHPVQQLPSFSSAFLHCL